jgi:hypothetical protein
MDVVHLKALDLIGQPPVLEKVPEFRAFDPPPDDHIKKLYDSAMKFLDALWTCVRIFEWADKIKDFVLDGLSNLPLSLRAAQRQKSPS